ncbi:MAG: N-6 DNA methylase [Gemmatimonadaceae bacterium]|nr:N-6 DNA methylase [Gemmatimonadaceae bacterium]
MTFHPGANEIEWLASLTTLAEEIGEEVFGYPIRWRVETGLRRRRNRSDVVIEDSGGTIIITGEAKRPDDPHGLTPLDVSEVDDAVGKAQHQGSRWCFTTNFHQIAVFDAGSGLMASPLSRLQGNVIPFIPSSLAQSTGWWAALSDDQRRQSTELGLRRLFERTRMLRQGEEALVLVDEVVVDFFSEFAAKLLDPLWRHFLNDNSARGATIRERALVAGLDIDDRQEARYLVAQGIFEVLSAALFYRLLADNFAELRPLLGGTSPRTSVVLANTVHASLTEAEGITGDYESILRLSAVGNWVLRHATADAVRHWNALLAFVDRLDLANLSSDVLGSIFERLISPERRREMGQHYTQPRLARSMAKWAVTSRDDIVLDPTCGAGTFLVETYGRQRDLGASHDEILARTYGNDLDPFAVHLAAINLATRRLRHGSNHPLGL